MQVGEQHLASPQLLTLGGKRLLDLHDQLRFGEYLVCVRRNLGARRHIGLIGEAGADACILLDEDAMPLKGQLMHR